MGECLAPLFLPFRRPYSAAYAVVALDVGVCQTDQCANLVLLLRCLDMGRTRIQTVLDSLSTQPHNRLLDSYTKLSSGRN
jgi:hypothetical protein